MSDLSQKRTIKLRDQSVEVEPLNAYKVDRAFDIAASVFDVIPDAEEQWRKIAIEYESQEGNTVEIPRATAQYQYGGPLRDRDSGMVVYDHLDRPVPGLIEHMTNEDWIASNQMLVLKRSLSGNERFVFFFRRYREQLKPLIYELLALVLAPERELEEKWNDGGDAAVDEHLRAQAGPLRHRLRIEEGLVALLSVWQELKAIRERHEDLGEVWDLIQGRGPDQDKKPQTSSDSDRPTPTPESGTEPASTSGSDEASDGSPERSSTDTPGESSERLVASST